MKTSKKLLAATIACAGLMMSGAPQAADSHTITVNATVNGTCKFNAGASTVNFTLDPTAATTLSQTDSIGYRCTKGTVPVFALSSGSTSSTTGGNLVNGSESIAYTFSSTSGGAGTGMGSGQDKTLAVTVSVDQSQAADVTPNTYTDTITVTLTP